MNRPAGTLALACAIAVVMVATPAFSGSSRGAMTRSGAIARPAVPLSRPNVVTRRAPPLARPNVITRPAPPLARPNVFTRSGAPFARPNVITRPAPPFRRAPGRIDGHRHFHHGPTIVFFESPFFGARPFGYPYSNYFLRYPYSSPFYTFGTAPPYVSLPPIATDPFYCWVDEIGFTDRERFAHHLHEVHGVPLEEALASAELVGGRYVFFGY
jgi:hypothetical protein